MIGGTEKETGNTHHSARTRLKSYSGNSQSAGPRGVQGSTRSNRTILCLLLPFYLLLPSGWQSGLALKVELLSLVDPSTKQYLVFHFYTFTSRSTVKTSSSILWLLYLHPLASYSLPS